MQQEITSPPATCSEKIYDSLLHDAAAIFDSPLHDAAERFDSLLHHAAGRQTSIQITPQI
jgi:hypothetical protein